MCREMNLAIGQGKLKVVNNAVYAVNKTPAFKYCPYCGKPFYEEFTTYHGGKLKPNSIRKHNLVYVWSKHTQSYILRLNY